MLTRHSYIFTLSVALAMMASVAWADNSAEGSDMPCEEDDEETQVQAPSQTEQESSPVLFDLQGRRVQHPIAGHIYIQNGRKVLVR